MRRAKKKNLEGARHQPFDQSAAINRKHLFLLIIFGVIIRVIYDIELVNNIFLNSYQLDSRVLYTWALDILKGDTANLAFFRAPLYPYILAFIYKIFGVSPWPVIIFQNLLGLMTGIVSYVFAGRLFGRQVALWSGMIVMIYPTLLIFEGETMITSLEVFLYTLTAFLIYLSIEKRTTFSIIGAGFALGLGAITRPIILPFMIIFPIAYLVKWGWHIKKEAVVKSIIFAVAGFVPIIPVTLTNIIKGGEFVLISTQGGANFYIGNSKDADGITVVALGPQLRMGKYDDNVWTSSIDVAERSTGRRMSQAEISSYWYNKALREIRQDIGRAMILYSKKFYYFWHGQEIINIKSLYSAGEYSLLVKALLWRKVIDFPSGILFPLMIMGMLFAIRNKEDVLVPVSFIIFLGLLISVFFICARFRQPVIPVATIFAAYAIHFFKKRFSHKPRNFAGAGMTLLILIMGLNWGGNLDSKENLSQFEAITGEAYMNKNDYSKAIEHLERSLEILPDNLGGFDMLGRSYLETGLVEKAQAIYQRGVELFPTYPLFNFGLGRIAQMNNDFPASKEFYNHTIKYSSDYAPAYELLAGIYEQEGSLDSALYFYRKLDSLGIPDPGASKLIKTKIQTLEKMLRERH